MLFSVLWIFFSLNRIKTENWDMKPSLFPRFGLPDCLHWDGGNGSSFLCSAEVLTCLWLGHTALLPSSILQLGTITIPLHCHFPRLQNALKSIQINKKSSHTGLLAVLPLLISNLWPQVSPPLPSDSPIFISEMLLQISPWPRRAQQNRELPPPLLLVFPAAAGGGVGSGLWVAWPRAWYFLLIIC